MKTINIYEAKAQLSKLVELAAAGEDVIIARGGRPIARLTSLDPKRAPFASAFLKGKVKVAKDFDAPLAPEILSQFEDR